MRLLLLHPSYVPRPPQPPSFTFSNIGRWVYKSWSSSMLTLGKYSEFPIYFLWSNRTLIWQIPMILRYVKNSHSFSQTNSNASGLLQARGLITRRRLTTSNISVHTGFRDHLEICEAGTCSSRRVKLIVLHLLSKSRERERLSPRFPPFHNEHN